MARTGTAHREQPPLPPLQHSVRRGGGFHSAAERAESPEPRGGGSARRGRRLARHLSRDHDPSRTERHGRRFLPFLSRGFFYTVPPHTYTYNTLRDAYRGHATGNEHLRRPVYRCRTRRLRDRHSPLDIRHSQFLRFFLSSSFLSRLSLDRYQLSLSDVTFKIEIPFANKFHYAIIFRRNLDTIPKLFRRIIDF